MPRSTKSPPDRDQRRRTILALLAKGRVRNQAELQEFLAAKGLLVNQGTLSRDLKDLGVVKGPLGYELPEDPAAVAADQAGTLRRALRQWLMQVVAAQNQVLLKTPAGGAQPLALALDRAKLPLVLGTVAGDDTVLVICAGPREAKRLARQLEARQLEEGP